MEEMGRGNTRTLTDSQGKLISRQLCVDLTIYLHWESRIYKFILDGLNMVGILSTGFIIHMGNLLTLDIQS